MEESGAKAQRQRHFAYKNAAIGELVLEQNQGGLEGIIWPCAVLFSNWMCANPDKIRGKVLIELGAGLGLPSFVAARLGAERMVVTDVDEALPLMRRNAEANSLPNIEPQRLFWGDEADMAAGAELRADAIVCTDIVYHQDEKGMRALVETISRLSPPDRDCPVWVAYEFRTIWVYDHVFFEIMKETGFVSTFESLEQFAEVPTDDNILFEFRRKEFVEKDKT
jgi:predicted nicotinamide N-methyase